MRMRWTCEQLPRRGTNFVADSNPGTLDGGTPSPWRAEQPGRILDLRCGVCWALFRWDYFGSRLIEIIKEGDPDGLGEAAARTDN